MEVLNGTDDGLSASVEQRLMVGAVIDEKGVLPVPGAKVSAQQGQDPVLGLDLAAKDPAKLRKADKALQ